MKQPTMHIDRCICAAKAFADLVQQAREQNLDLQTLAQRTTATQGCGLCKPYVRKALSTGQTVFDQLLTDTPDTDT